MDKRELKEKHPVLEKIVSAAMFIPEATIYQISDLLTIPARNWVIPRALKRELSCLSCRDYYGKNLARCMPVKKYYHEWMFLFRFVCRSYDYESGRCIKYEKD